MTRAVALTDRTPAGEAPLDRRLVLGAGALLFAALPSLPSLPPWVSALLLLSLLVRAAGLLKPGRLATRLLLVLLATGVTAGVLAGFRTLNGLPAGTTLLVAMAALKLQESRSSRDIAVLVFISYFLCLASLLAAPTVFRLVHALLASWLATVALLESQRPAAAAPLRGPRTAARLLAIGTPLAVILFCFVPRLEGRFWALPSGGSEATTGIAEEMNPGAIARLAQSEEPAFRARFDTEVPRRQDRYWRVLTLDNFNGAAWRRSAAATGGGRPALPDSRGPGLGYTVSVEPSHQAWLPTLERMLSWSAVTARHEGDGTLLAIDPDSGQPLRVDKLLAFTARSDPAARLAAGGLSAAERQRALELPRNVAPRAQALARELASTHPEPHALIEAVLGRFRDEPYVYTLEPPPLEGDATDAFLFTTRAGFCEHYASAFTVLMRSAGLPARVVIGYQGGDLNPYGGYLLVRQSAAHAWSEVWLPGEGWLRVDPTAAIAPGRIRDGLDAALPERRQRGTLYQLPWIRQAGEAVDAIRAGWNRFVVGYSSRQQERLLENLGWTGSPLTGLALMIVGGFAAAAALYALLEQVRTRRRDADPVVRAWQRACARLARRGLAREPSEGPLDFARRVRARRPADAEAFDRIAALYVAARYERNAGPAGLRALVAAVARFRPA